MDGFFQAICMGVCILPAMVAATVAGYRAADKGKIPATAYWVAMVFAWGFVALAIFAQAHYMFVVEPNLPVDAP